MDDARLSGGDSPVAAGPPGGAETGWAGIAEVVVILALALGAWVMSAGFADSDLMVAYGMDPAVVPRAIILVIVGLAGLLLVGQLAQVRGRPALRLHPRLGVVAFAFAVLAIYAFTFEAFGAFTLMPVFCVLLSLAFERHSLWRLAAYGVGVSIMTWVIFVLLLRAPLPGPRMIFG